MVDFIDFDTNSVVNQDEAIVELSYDYADSDTAETFAEQARALFEKKEVNADVDVMEGDPDEDDWLIVNIQIEKEGLDETSLKEIVETLDNLA